VGMSKGYTLKIDLSAYEELDKFALLADQNYNLSNKGDWFNHFRGGIYGLYARVQGVQIHYYKVHSWDLDIKNPSMTEYHVSSILFNMDSAIECLVFALNALGYATSSDKFFDVTNEKDLAKISPANILGKPPEYKTYRQGYDIFFPSVRQFWYENRYLIHTISEQHDVSKHRSTIYAGGKSRNDPPPGFFERLGIKDNQIAQVIITPMEEIILTYQPKTPWRQRKTPTYKDTDKLEDIAEKFCAFINICGLKVLEDARSNIKLNYYEFQKIDVSK
jgi:hypothetical protein